MTSTAQQSACVAAVAASSPAQHLEDAAPTTQPPDGPAAAPSPSVYGTLIGRLARYELLEQIGHGAYAEVRRARNAQHAANGLPEFVAVKTIDLTRVEGGRAAVENEVMIMETVGDYPFLTRLFEVVYAEESVSLCMELVQGGELFDRLAARGAYTEEDAALLMAELFDALASLHGLGIVHRDIKPENICYVSSEPGSSIKLIDFGYATVLELDGTRRRELGPSGFCGTARYLAPEQISEDGADTTAHDMWAAGVVLYILLCGYPPFVREMPELYDDIKAAHYDFPPPHWDSISDDGKALVRALLTVDPEQRLTAEQAAEHRWVVTCAGALDERLGA